MFWAQTNCRSARSCWLGRAASLRRAACSGCCCAQGRCAAACRSGARKRYRHKRAGLQRASAGLGESSTMAEARIAITRLVVRRLVPRMPAPRYFARICVLRDCLELKRLGIWFLDRRPFRLERISLVSLAKMLQIKDESYLVSLKRSRLKTLVVSGFRDADR